MLYGYIAYTQQIIVIYAHTWNKNKRRSQDLWLEVAAHWRGVWPNLSPTFIKSPEKWTFKLMLLDITRITVLYGGLLIRYRAYFSVNFELNLSKISVGVKDDHYFPRNLEPYSYWPKVNKWCVAVELHTELHSHWKRNSESGYPEICWPTHKVMCKL